MKASDVKKYNVFSSLCLIFRGPVSLLWTFSGDFTDNTCECPMYPPNKTGGGAGGQMIGG